MESATLTTQQAEEKSQILNSIAHAPAIAFANPKIKGWWTPAGWFICENCTARIHARGCTIPAKSEPVWKGDAEPYGVCLCCEGGK